MPEKIVQFGPENNLIGIVSEPEDLIAGRPVVLILNSGLIHRIGPYRMGVDFARRLADHGYLVLRFDLSNIGDSSGYSASTDFRERTVFEIGSAMDAMEKRYQANDFIAIGLCTGAMNAHLIATNDRRVKGVVMLDGYVYPTLRFYFNRFAGSARSILHPGNLSSKIKNLFNIKQKSVELGGDEGIDYWNLPPKSEIQNDLQQLTSRGVNLLFIYSGGLHYYYNYKSQLEDSFRSVNFKDLVETHYFREMDHTFTLLGDRRIMLDTIFHWLACRYLN